MGKERERTAEWVGRRLLLAAGCSRLVGGWENRHADSFHRLVEVFSHQDRLLAISRPAMGKPLGRFAHSLDVGMRKPFRKHSKPRKSGIWCQGKPVEKPRKETLAQFSRGKADLNFFREPPAAQRPADRYGPDDSSCR